MIKNKSANKIQNPKLQKFMIIMKTNPNPPFPKTEIPDNSLNIKTSNFQTKYTISYFSKT